MKAFIAAVVIAVGLAVAARYVLVDNFQETARQAFATSGVRL